MYRRKLKIAEFDEKIFIGDSMKIERLEKLRDENDLLKKEVAKDIGVVESVYSEWENGILSIPTRRIYQLANYFEVNIDYIFGLSDERKHIISNLDLNVIDVASKLKMIRKEQKLTMRDLAKKLNTSPSAICNYEKGKFLILGSFLIYICKTYGYSADWILGRSKEKFIKKVK